MPKAETISASAHTTSRPYPASLPPKPIASGSAGASASAMTPSFTIDPSTLVDLLGDQGGSLQPASQALFDRCFAAVHGKGKRGQLDAALKTLAPALEEAKDKLQIIVLSECASMLACSAACVPPVILCLPGHTTTGMVDATLPVEDKQDKNASAGSCSPSTGQEEQVIKSIARDAAKRSPASPPASTQKLPYDKAAFIIDLSVYLPDVHSSQWRYLASRVWSVTPQANPGSTGPQPAPRVACTVTLAVRINNMDVVWRHTTGYDFPKTAWAHAAAIAGLIEAEGSASNIQEEYHPWYLSSPQTHLWSILRHHFGEDSAFDRVVSYGAQEYSRLWIGLPACISATFALLQVAFEHSQVRLLFTPSHSDNRRAVAQIPEPPVPICPFPHKKPPLAPPPPASTSHSSFMKEMHGGSLLVEVHRPQGAPLQYTFSTGAEAFSTTLKAQQAVASLALRGGIVEQIAEDLGQPLSSSSLDLLDPEAVGSLRDPFREVLLLLKDKVGGSDSSPT